MLGQNKAHAAVCNRIFKRYGGRLGRYEGPDVQASGFLVEVETTATLEDGKNSLLRQEGPRYLAVTNREAVPEALKVVAGTPLGVMDPQGNILRPYAST